MTEKKTDDEIFRSLKNLFELYKNGAKDGKYYKFLPEDFVAKRIDPGSRQTAASIEDGLHELGKIAYRAVTGICEDNDRSIKLDGYPKIDSMMWPVLEMMLSRQEAPDIDRIEEKIKEAGEKKGRGEKTAEGGKKNKEQLLKELVLMFGGLDESVFEETVMEARKMIYPVCFHYASIETRDAGEFLDKVFAWMRERTGFKDEVDWKWSYDVKSCLVDMHARGDANIFRDGGFIDVTEKISFPANADKSCDIYDLKKILNGRRIVSVYDENEENWYLRICE
ncbi:MAG: hypothetical protein WC788_01790 [Candidatus Paceibacterota bacterium]|jgi:hypothetical protein